MDDQRFIETRASILWWFSSLFSKELNEQQFEQYINQQGAHFLNQLGKIPELSQDIKALQQSLKTLNAKAYPYLESAVEFTQIFLTNHKTGAPPYASVYLSKDGLMFQEPHKNMLSLLQAQGLSIQENFNEPADHLAIQLDYLGNLILTELNANNPQQILQNEKVFIEEQLLNWLPHLQKKISHIEQSGFYQHLSNLLIHYLQFELQNIAIEA